MPGAAAVVCMGGYTTLAALARDDTPFVAGADHFGLSRHRCGSSRGFLVG